MFRLIWSFPHLISLGLCRVTVVRRLTEPESARLHSLSLDAASIHLVELSVSGALADQQYFPPRGVFGNSLRKVYLEFTLSDWGRTGFHQLFSMSAGLQDVRICPTLSDSDTTRAELLSVLQVNPKPYGDNLRRVAMHPLLLAVRDGSYAPLDWDMSLPVRSLCPRYPSRLTDSLLSEPTTDPPMQSFTAICPRLPWKIIVTPDGAAAWAAPYVTVGDVQHTLHRSLHMRAMEDQFGLLNRAVRDRVGDAYVRRYRRIRVQRDRDAEKAKGIKRIDFLRDYRAFYGFSLVQGDLPPVLLPQVRLWTLHVGRL
ncbi:hypothetical protein C8T65DRAFT_838359 [Cerioporus squamosus]|nr:hypothetical protein C8T65DRAFT_838359 [Cerioporus squamosus]